MSNVTIAVDTAKNVFEVVISAAAGQIRERRRMSRHQFERFWSTREPCRVLMEGCSGSHHWARLLIGLGFEVKLIPPRYVTPYGLSPGDPGPSPGRSRWVRVAGCEDARG